MTSKYKKLVLVDGSSYLFRAYHALPPLTTSTGMPTGALYGVLNMLRKLLNDEKPDYFGVVFDTKSKNFRHEIYPAYKANRPEMPDELAVQIEPLHTMIKAMGLPLIAIEGVEADDVLATLAHRATEQKIKTIISTGDKDLAQLVDEHITLVNTMNGNVLDENNVMAKFGVRADQIVDYLTLMGDPVDNVPGVPKVGPKTAAKWLEEYDNLDNLIRHADDIKGKVGENLREHLSELPLGKKLVTVQRDVALPIAAKDLLLQPADKTQLKELYQKYELKSWLRELDKETTPSTETAASIEKGKHEIILTQEQFQHWINLIQKEKAVAIDTETTALDPFLAECVGISFAVKPGEAAYVPVGHHYLDCPKQLSRDEVLAQLKPILEDPHIKKIGQNIKYDMHIFANYGIKLKAVADDTMLESYVLNSIATRHNMDSLAEYYFQYQTIHYEDVVGKGVKQINFSEVELQTATEYAAEDADITLRLHQVLSSKLADKPSLVALYRDIEMALVEVLWQMEQHGVCVDATLLQKQSEQIAQELIKLEEQATILAGQSFNLSSPKQLQEIFYDKLKLPILERTPKGAPSTAESVLQELSHDYELPKVILNHRTLSKLKSTYTDKLPLQINPRTKRVHTSYNQAVTATGRLSSTDPNLQNIPIRTPEGRKIRQAFIAAPGCKLLAADYSQIELRIMAHLSQDEGLLTAFSHGEDIHRFTASEVLGVPLDQVTPEQRRSAKAINFGLIYGMSAFGLARQLEVQREAAQKYMDQYFHRYPGVKKYMEMIREKAAQLGYVETLFGRRLYLPDILSKNMGRRRAAERTAINAPMQGTAADIIKKAMIAIHQDLPKYREVKMLMQVHDELIFEIEDTAIEKAKSFITHCMQNTVELSVPLVVNVGVGFNWDEAH
ncbi:MAG: DNA polymerase I [Candidatus Berkiellales bacterium]